MPHRHRQHPDPLPFLPRWVPAAAARPSMSPAWWDWLASTESLTARLIAASQPQAFKVALLYQGICLPLADESVALGLPARRYAWVREVALCVKGTPWVRARSVAPLEGLRGLRLDTLGERSLGSWLFRQPGITRGPIDITAQRPPFPQSSVWGRRSRFCYRQTSLLVQEHFLTGMRDALSLPRR